MNKTLRLLLLIGLAIFIYASCSKDKDFLDIPDTYDQNGSVPFSIDTVPPEGCDTIIFFRIKENDSIKTPFNPTDVSLEFKTGDSIILETYAKSGYTFINWVRNGKGVSNDHIYGFKLEKKDIDTTKKWVKHHYEARFGLDYAIQSIPPIDKIMPADLIAAMGPYLNFGDNPPRIDRCFTIPEYHLFLDTVIQYDTSELYGSSYSLPMEISMQSNTFLFEKQHRCIAEGHYYERCNWEGLFYYYANVTDSIFIMGHDDSFTAYFHQSWNPWVTGLAASGMPYWENLTRIESVILSGKIVNNTIEDFHWGIQIDRYNFDKNTIGTNKDPKIGDRLPGVYDILIMSSDQAIPIDTSFQKHF